MGRILLGVAMAVVAGATMAYAIVNLAQLGSCAGSCPDHLVFVPALMLGLGALGAAWFLWDGAPVVAPVVGLATAGVLAWRDGVQLTGESLGLTAVVTLGVLSGPVAVGLFWAHARRRRRTAAELVATGSRAVAVIQAVRQTSLYVNNRPQVEVTYHVRPLDGAPAFTATKKQLIGYGEVAPRPGLAWPAWYDPGNHSRLAVGAPTGSALDPATQAQLFAFGLTPEQAYGYNPLGAAGPAAPAGPSGFGAPQGFGR